MAEAKKYVWLPDEYQVWKLGEIIKVNSDNGNLIVNDDEGLSSTVDGATALRVDPNDLKDISDLYGVNQLHDAPLLNILRFRYLQDNIYTASGKVLLSVNPYKVVPEMFDNPEHFFKLEDSPSSRQASSAVDEGDSDSSSNPHIFAFTNKVLNALVRKPAKRVAQASELATAEDVESSKRNQTIVILGESGSGKTEAAKLVMEFLGHANSAILQEKNDKFTDLSDVMLQFNVVFESLGNAKTIHNDNATRLSRFLRMWYSEENIFVGASVTFFQLERSRVIHLNPKERNFHVFYQFVRGLHSSNPDMAAELHLTSANDFSILTEGQCTTIFSEEDDVSDFASFEEALKAMGCSEDDLLSVWEILACILHLGNVTCSVAGSSVSISCATMPVDDICLLLGIHEDAFTAIISNQMATVSNRKSTFIDSPTEENCRNNIQSLMKHLYWRLICWMTQKANYMLALYLSSQMRLTAVKHIDILDASGFEVLELNSLEQLCINYSNERLQKLFNDTIILAEQQAFANEGLEWKAVPSPFSSDVIDLLDKRPSGLFALIEEHSALSKVPDDKGLLRAMNQIHDKPGKSPFTKPRFGNSGFDVKHYAASVSYSIDAFLLRNNDALQPDLANLLMGSVNRFLVGILSFHAITSADPGFIPILPAMSVLEQKTDENLRPIAKRKVSTSSATSVNFVSFAFKENLNHILGTMSENTLHFIYCIKPNCEKASDMFASDLVLSQLHVSNIINHISAQRQGFQSRMRVFEFCRKYYILGKMVSEDSFPDLRRAKEVVSVIAPRYLAKSQFQIGKNYIFMKENCVNVLEKAKLKVQSAVVSLCLAFSRANKCRRARALLLALRQEKIDREIREAEAKARWEAEEKLRLQREAEERAREAAAAQLRKETEERAAKAAEIVARKESVLKKQQESLSKLKARAQSKLPAGKESQEEVTSTSATTSVVAATGAAATPSPALPSGSGTRASFSAPSGPRASITGSAGPRASFTTASSSMDISANASTLSMVSQGTEGTSLSRVKSAFFDDIDEDEVVIKHKEHHTTTRAEIPADVQFIPKQIDQEQSQSDSESSSANSSFYDSSKTFSRPPPLRTTDSFNYKAVEDGLSSVRIDSTHARHSPLRRTGSARFLRPKRPVGEVHEPHASYGEKATKALTCVVRNYVFLRRIWALHAACELGEVEWVKILVEAHPDDRYVLNQSLGFTTVYHAAIRGGSIAVLELLGLSEARIKYVQPMYGNLIHYAAQNNSKLSMIQYLVDRLTMSSSHCFYKVSSPPKISTKLKVGWLYKKNSTRTWVLRQVNLTDTGIEYAKKAEDAILDCFPLHKGCAVYSRKVTESSTFSIKLKPESGVLSTKKNRREISFRAAGENELQEWMKLLSAYSQLSSFRETGAPYYFNFCDLRADLLAVTCFNGDTPLHCLSAWQRGSQDGDASEMNMAASALWLISNGCPLNAKNYEGKTALFVAVENRNFEFAKLLQRLGADTITAPGYPPIWELSLGALVAGQFDKDPFRGLKPKFAKCLFGYNYLSFHFQFQGKIPGSELESFSSMESVQLIASIVGEDNLVVDSPQELSHPAVVRHNCMWWGHSFLSTTPIELLPSSFTLVVLMKAKDSESKEMKTICWSCQRFDKATINVDYQTLYFLEGDVNLHDESLGLVPFNGSYLDVEVGIQQRSFGGVPTRRADRSHGVFSRYRYLSSVDADALASADVKDPSGINSLPRVVHGDSVAPPSILDMDMDEHVLLYPHQRKRKLTSALVTRRRPSEDAEEVSDVPALEDYASEVLDDSVKRRTDSIDSYHVSATVSPRHSRSVAFAEDAKDSPTSNPPAHQGPQRPNLRLDLTNEDRKEGPESARKVHFKFGEPSPDADHSGFDTGRTDDSLVDDDYTVSFKTKKVFNFQNITIRHSASLKADDMDVIPTTPANRDASPRSMHRYDSFLDDKGVKVAIGMRLKERTAQQIANGSPKSAGGFDTDDIPTLKSPRSKLERYDSRFDMSEADESVKIVLHNRAKKIAGKAKIVKFNAPKIVTGNSFELTIPAESSPTRTDRKTIVPSAATPKPSSVTPKGLSEKEFHAPKSLTVYKELDEKIALRRKYLMNCLLRNHLLKTRVNRLMQACETGRLDVVKQIIEANPKYKYTVRHGKDPVSLYHAAVKGSQVSVLGYLGMKCEELLQMRQQLLPLIHYAAEHNVRLSMMKFLVSMLTVHSSSRVHNEADYLPYNACLKSGWMFKKNSNDSWNHRWVVLTDCAIQYYQTHEDKEPCDIFPLHKSFASYRVMHDSYTIVIKLVKRSSTLKRRRCLELRAANRTELQEWLKFLSPSVRLVDFRPGASAHPCGYAPDALPIIYYAHETVVDIVSSTNEFGDSPLHCLARFRGDAVASPDSADVEDVLLSEEQELNMIACATWLLSSGCPLNKANGEQKTAIFVAAESGNFKLAKFLQSLKRLPHPPIQYGLTYLSIHFQLLGSIPRALPKKSKGQYYRMVRFDYLGEIIMTINAYNSQGDLLQPSHVMTDPSIVRPSHLWWGKSWNLTTPLEDLRNGCFIIVTLRTRSFKTGTLTGDLCWACLKLNKERLQSDIMVLNFSSGPVDFNNLDTQEVNANGSFVDIDVGIMRRADIAVEDYVEETPAPTAALFKPSRSKSVSAAAQSPVQSPPAANPSSFLSRAFSPPTPPPAEVATAVGSSSAAPARSPPPIPPRPSSAARRLFNNDADHEGTTAGSESSSGTGTGAAVGENDSSATASDGEVLTRTASPQPAPVSLKLFATDNPLKGAHSVARKSMHTPTTDTKKDDHSGDTSDSPTPVTPITPTTPGTPASPGSVITSDGTASPDGSGVTASAKKRAMNLPAPRRKTVTISAAAAVALVDAVSAADTAAVGGASPGPSVGQDAAVSALMSSDSPQPHKGSKGLPPLLSSAPKEPDQQQQQQQQQQSQEGVASPRKSPGIRRSNSISALMFGPGRLPINASSPPPVPVKAKAVSSKGDHNSSSSSNSISSGSKPKSPVSHRFTASMSALFGASKTAKQSWKHDSRTSLAGVPLVNSLQLVSGVHTPVHIMLRLPPKAVPGTLISNIGGRKDRSIIVPAGLKPGDMVIIAAVP